MSNAPPQNASEQLGTAMPSTYDLPNPTLVRTSTLRPLHAHQLMSAPQGGSFNPYALAPHKAVLKLQGSLDAMAENWSGEEWPRLRRLVQFRRQQKGSTINAYHRPPSLKTMDIAYHHPHSYAPFLIIWSSCP